MLYFNKLHINLFLVSDQSVYYISLNIDSKINDLKMFCIPLIYYYSHNIHNKLVSCIIPNLT